ncbi:MAG: hypothetical protein CMJ65_02460 [Planctomycetaceae bacterium]|nr:hypothetical protein [Planctomycetaceae bacterium]
MSSPQNAGDHRLCSKRRKTNMRYQIAGYLVGLLCTHAVAGELKVDSLQDLRIAPAAVTKTQALISSQLRSGQLAGVTVCILRRGRVAHLRAYGYRDATTKTPARVDDIVRIYSMSKPIVSAAAMQLWEQGRFALDDPLADYIPAFRQMKVLVTDQAADGKPRHRLVAARRQITIRDAFRHTTGIAYGGDLVKPVNQHYVANDLVYWSNGMYAPKYTLLDGMSRLGRVPLLHHPGDQFTYGLNVDILGRLIEVCSGCQLSVYLRQRMFQPLGMVDTAFHVPDDKLSRFGPVHDKNKQGKFYRLAAAATSPYRLPPRWESGGGGLVSTITDYARFCQAILDGGKFQGHRILKRSTIDLMFANQLPSGQSRRFGLGFGITSQEFGSGSHRRKATVYAWGGYASTKFHVVPAEKLVLITMRQRVPGNSICWTKLVPIVHESLRPLDD